MKVKKEGQILQLEPNKQYIMIVKKGSILEKEVRQGHIEMKNGRIFFVGNMNEFRFVENSERIANIKLEDKE